MAKVLNGQGTRFAAVEDTAAMLIRQINEDDERETTMTKTDVRAEVDALADELVAKGDADNLIEARAKVWHDNPALVTKSRRETRSPARPKVPPGAVAGPR